MAERSGNDKKTRKAWDDVGEQFSDVGKKIGEHYRSLESDTRTSAETQRQTVNDAIKKVVDEMDKAFTGLGNALRDPQTKDSLNKAAKSLGDALDSTFSGLGQKLRPRSSKDEPGATGPGEPDDKPPPEAF
jgi:trans-2-enoyl-CoA reductase